MAVTSIAPSYLLSAKALASVAGVPSGVAAATPTAVANHPILAADATQLPTTSASPDVAIADQTDSENFPPPPQGLLSDPVGQPIPKFGTWLTHLSTKGNQILNGWGMPVRLRGVNLSGFEYDPLGSPELQPANLPALFSHLSKLGVNVVRIPFNQLWASSPDYVQRLDAVAAAANAKGTYVIFDMHWAATDGMGTQMGQVKCLTTAMLQTWRQLAAHWANQPGILYDIQNEPEGISWKTYAPWAQAAIDNIRAVNPKALVMVEGTQWGSDLSQVLGSPLRGSNIVYSVHEYGPSYGPADAGPQLWDQLFGSVAQKYPVFVGEFGGNATDLAYGNQLLGYLDARGLSWCAWNWGESVPQLEQGGNLTPFGQLVTSDLKPKSTAAAIEGDFATFTATLSNWKASFLNLFLPKN
ncbi:MAG: cellulase family glycosylhydrolase [Cyanobacteria bacterium REEB65]|nr:cellulase family glycosylhydrolase [Cyanobacteria bacterium REEB65]